MKKQKVGILATAFSFTKKLAIAKLYPKQLSETSF